MFAGRAHGDQVDEAITGHGIRVKTAPGARIHEFEQLVGFVGRR